MDNAVAIAILSLAGIVAVGIVSLWGAIALDAIVAGRGTPALPAAWGVLADPLSSLHRPWLALAVLAVEVAAVTWCGVAVGRHVAERRRREVHRRRQLDRQKSGTWADTSGLSSMTDSSSDDGRTGRLFVGTHAGKEVLLPERTSLMVVAPTRTGKSSRVVVPNLLRWDGPAVATSVKRDVYDLTVNRRRTFGPVSLFDPTGATGLASMRWSPLLSSRDFPSATQTASWLADAAAVEDKGDSARFWETLATKFLAPMLYAAANTGRTITDVSHWVDRSAFDEVAEILTSLGDQDAEAAWQAIRDLPTETRGSVLGTAMAIFRAFGSPRVRDRTSCHPGDLDDSIDIDDLLRANGTLYLVSPEHEQAELRPLFTALVQAVYRRAVEVSARMLDGAPLHPPLLLMLDEAGNIAPMRNLPKVASTGAGQGITLATIWQDRAQIHELYGQSDRTVIANHTTSLWLPGSQDLDTLTFLGNLIGDQWVASDTRSVGPDGSVSQSRSTERIEVAPPSFLRTLDHGTAVMLHGNVPPALVDTHAYYEQRRWRRHIPHDVRTRYADMHTGNGSTTRDAWHVETTSTPAEKPDVAPTPRNEDTLGLSDLLGASSPEVVGDRRQRVRYGPTAAVIPASLPGGRRPWPPAWTPPPLVAGKLGTSGPLDLTRRPRRVEVVSALASVGPPEALVDLVTLPMLCDLWIDLDLPLRLRGAWQDIYPTLVKEHVRV